MLLGSVPHAESPKQPDWMPSNPDLCKFDCCFMVLLILMSFEHSTGKPNKEPRKESLFVIVLPVVPLPPVIFSVDDENVKT